MRLSHQQIQGFYKAFGAKLTECAELKERIHLPPYGTSSAGDVMIDAFDRQVFQIDSVLGDLDKEIERRNNLVGVI